MSRVKTAGTQDILSCLCVFDVARNLLIVETSDV